MSWLELRRHNQTVLDNLEPGDRLQFKRGVYDHWAVYVGNTEVVHLSGSVLGQLFAISGVQCDTGIIRKDYFWDVVENSKVYRNNSKDAKFKPFEPIEIVRRALSKIGERGYNLLYKNCEHFASWCRNDKEESDQADGLLTGLAVGGVTLVAAGLTALAALAAWLGSGRKERRNQSDY